MDTATLPKFLTRRTALDFGETDVGLARRRRRGELVGVRPGVYLSAADVFGLRPEDRHRLAALAALPHAAPDACLSHVSAAVLHGIPLWSTPLDRVHMTRPGLTGGHRRRTLHVHMSRLDETDVVERDGVPVTSPARTVVDLASSIGFEQAVVAADGALSRNLTTAADLSDQLGRAVNRRGIARARRVVAVADGRSESVGESRSRVVLSSVGVIPDELQAVIRDDGGEFLARVDFLFNGGTTVGEFDGAMKYGRSSVDPRPAGEVVFAEKLREDALREAGHSVVRWVWRDLDDPTALAARIRRADRTSIRR